MATRLTRNHKKICEACNEHIDVSEYPAHIATCTSTEDDDVRLPMKICPLCDKTVKDLSQHYPTCAGGNNTLNDTPRSPRRSPAAPVHQYPIDNVSSRRKTKECMICSRTIPEEQFIDHTNECGAQLSAKPKTTKICITCSKDILAVDYVTHVDKCVAELMGTKSCIICDKHIAEHDYVTHVDKCLSQSSKTSNAKSVTQQTTKSCFGCSSPVNSTNNSSHNMPCQSHHIYCIKCLQHMVNEYIQSNTPPVCHSAVCDYQLSRYDVACLPLEPDIIKRLLTCVKTAQRAQCPLCMFYVDFNTMSDLERHSASCNSESLVSCEHCHCLYNIHRLDEHERQCRNVAHSQRQQALIDFILPRTKYPITAAQLRFFIAHQKKNRLPLDPHQIVDALAEFNGAFPFEIPTRECIVCSDQYVFDDIFVFGCDQNHKICYECFEQSCSTKLKNNEILTCAECTYQLTDGEINQLRISPDQKSQFREYQNRMTFNAYKGNTRGVIKCPNQGCNWVVEAHDPNERFLVKCALCKHEFCSLCNQQYHYRTTCQQIPEITQRWFFWCDSERGNYWRTKAQQDANFTAQLQDYEQQKAANVQRNEELRQRYTELVADETYKAQSCRLCPHCQRVVQHLGGCSSMICGQNYHGGDIQSGCGKNFNWSQATPYVPIANTGPAQVRVDLAAPSRQQTIVHEGVQCDACHKDAQGICFVCVHCPSLTYCETCEQRHTLEHSNRNRNDRKQQHVFQLITQPQAQ